MKKWLRPYYRIINYREGYSYESWRWWFPFWTTIGVPVYYVSCELAVKAAKTDAATGHVVKNLGQL